MKAHSIQTSWGTIALRLDEFGNVISCTLPHIDKAPHTPFSFLSFQSLENNQCCTLSGFQSLEDIVNFFPIIGTLPGSCFQQEVWRALQDIPYGQTRTYGVIAKAIGRPKAVRAVGSACGANPLPLFIPCHRVVAANGGLGGFSAGMAWKTLLQQLEETGPPDCS